MALLTSSSRRFARSNRYSHEQRRERVTQVRERIDLVAPAGPVPAGEAPIAVRG
jgi:hypothetical protein